MLPSQKRDQLAGTNEDRRRIFAEVVEAVLSYLSAFEHHQIVGSKQVNISLGRNPAWYATFDACTALQVKKGFNL